MVGIADTQAFLWQSDAGFKTLASLLPAGSQWVPISAQAINDSGAIVGWGYNNAVNAEVVHAFIMKP